MLFLIFELGHDRYALLASLITEVLPPVRIERVPHAPPGVIGVSTITARQAGDRLIEFTLGCPPTPRRQRDSWAALPVERPSPEFVHQTIRNQAYGEEDASPNDHHVVKIAEHRHEVGNQIDRTVRIRGDGGPPARVLGMV